MSVDQATVRRIAHLARIAVTDDEVPHLQGELNAILAFVEQLNEVDVSNVEPMTSVTPMAMKKRQDVVSDGGIPDLIVANAPEREGHFFAVPSSTPMCWRRRSRRWRWRASDARIAKGEAGPLEGHSARRQGPVLRPRRAHHGLLEDPRQLRAAV
jgi:aspartyl-tRNA(Asn)/glutamyl-tRNA(Gln) amidotransferase subunit C